MRTIKIYNDEKEIYRGSCSVNTAVLRGKICGEIKQAGKGAVKFSLRLSNGKNEKTGEWNPATFTDCTAFSDTAKKILKGYKEKDEIWILAKYYSKKHEEKFYKGFIVRDVISGKEIKEANNGVIDEDNLPF